MVTALDEVGIEADEDVVMLKLLLVSYTKLVTNNTQNYALKLGSGLARSC